MSQEEMEEKMLEDLGFRELLWDGRRVVPGWLNDMVSRLVDSGWVKESL